MAHHTLPAAIALLVSGNLVAAPLFDSEDTLEIALEAPFRELSGNSEQEPELPGTVRYVDESGMERSLPVIVTTRGKTRLEICDYPPLRLTFDAGRTAGTLFEGQRKLKMVRPCKRGGKARDWLYLELGIYRAYNLISDYSYRVRQLNVNFFNSESRFGSFSEQPAFFIEDDDDMARRLNRERIRPPKVDLAQMSPRETSVNILFQYLIGNTDFAVKRGPSGEGCCHNGRVLAEPGKQADWVIVPYDFDYAGIIDADYAVPHEALGIRKVTARLYRGFCWQNDLLPESIELFNRNRTALEAALIPSGVSAPKSRRVRSYIDKFFDIVNDPAEAQLNLYDRCREPDSIPLRERAVSPRKAQPH